MEDFEMAMNAMRGSLVKAGLGLAMGAALMAAAPGAWAEDWNKSFSVNGRASVKVDSNDAGVRITTSDDTKEVQFHVIYEGYTVDRDLRLEAHQDGDRVELSCRVPNGWHFGWGKNSRRVQIEVKMPKAADLQVSTGDGAVETSELNGNVTISTGDGSVKAHGVSGTVDLHTGDGSIAVDGLRGDIKLRTGDGSIEAHGLDGRVVADSGDGHIRLDGRFDGLNIRTGDGSVDARVGNGSKVASGWNIHTGDGSVDIALPGDLQANIDASTGDGHISMGLPVTIEGSFSNSQIHGKMNGGGEPVVIHTSDGSIRVNKS
jgi:hypothetical protein